MNEPVKPEWRSGRDIVNERGKTIYKLFDLMKKGLQAYTNTHEKIVDCDFLLKPRRKLLEYITAEVGREFASLTGPPFSEDEINLTAKQRYNIWTGGILDHQIGCELMSFDEMVKNSLSEVWDFQFKTADVDKFFDNEYSQSHPLLSYEETQNEMERKAWDIISDLTGIGPEEMQNAINKYYQSIMVNNRAIIRAGSEESQNGTADPLLSIIVNNRSIIADLAGSKGTESERELKASYLISTLAGSEEIQNETADLQKQERTIEEKINLEYLRDTAHEWIKDHPVIKSIYLVTANRTDGKEVHAHYRYTLIAIVPTPDDDYRNWAGDGFNYNFPEDDLRDCGLVDLSSWVTAANMDEALEYVDENIKDNLQKGARVKWDDLTGDVESQEANQSIAPQKEETVMALQKPPFVSIQRAAIELGVSDEDIKYNLKEGHLATYLPTPWLNVNLNHKGKLAEVAKVIIPFLIEGDKIYFKNLHLLAKDTMKKVDEIRGGNYYIKDVLISFAEIEKLRSTKNQEIEPLKQPKQTANEIKDHESFIQSLQVSYVNDTEIKIKGGGKNAKIYGMKELGFEKEKSQAWKEFIKILESKDHFYYVGKAHGAKRVRKKSYDVGQKVLVQINKKLVSFFNKIFQLQLSERFKVYELIPEKGAAPGTYRFKFQIKNNSDTDIKGFKELSKEELLSKIETLSDDYATLSKKGDEEAEKKILKIKDQLNDTVVIACEKGWLTQNRAAAYLNPKDDPLPVEPSIKDEDSIQED